MFYLSDVKKYSQLILTYRLTCFKQIKIKTKNTGNTNNFENPSKEKCEIIKRRILFNKIEIEIILKNLINSFLVMISISLFET